MTEISTHRATVATRMLGVLGILGGLGLLAAFVVDIPAGWNTVRIVLWDAGAAAVALATYGRHAAISRPLALVATTPVVAASSWAILWTLLAIGRDSPFSGDFGLVGFWVRLAAGLAVAIFGLLAWRLGVLWRWASLALVLGALMGITGMDRLALTSSKDPTIFEPIALAGIVLVGVAWVLLGIDVAMAYPRPGWRRGDSFPERAP
jgi:hypothetical protein